MSARALNYRIRPGSRLAPETPPEGASDPSDVLALDTATDAMPKAQKQPQPAAQPKAQPTAQPDAGDGGAAKKSAGASAIEAIEAIKREGLSGRQLRAARRTAQKHGLTPGSDYDAVRMLREQGIDPFERSNVLQLGKPAQKAQLPAPTEGAQLPQTVKPAPAPALLPDAPDPEASRMSEVRRIQLDMARRRRRSLIMMMVRMFLFIVLPSLAAAYYYYRIATPLYATKSEFVIQQAEAQGASGLGGLFQGTGLAVQQDSTTVQSYLQSRDAMRRLDAELGFRAHWEQDFLDPVQRLAPGSSFEDAYKVYRKKVIIGLDPAEGILKMEVIAADPETSQAFAERLIGYAEERVDNLTKRLRDDQMAGARESYAEAERKMIESQARVLDLQERLGVLDPMSETSSMMSQITQFETQLRTKELELDQQMDNQRPNQAKVNALRGEINRLRELVADLRSSMTEGVDGAASLARISGELRIAEADLATRQTLLQQAAAQMETARIEANRQTRYITVGVLPIAPDDPTYPRAGENTALAVVVFAGIYLMLSVTVSVLREQVSA